jgi:hypothetical protein
MGEVFTFLKLFVNFARNTLRQANLGGGTGDDDPLERSHLIFLLQQTKAP